ncbi:MAG: putative endonuclease, partial [Oceanospirillaceae bacterium]
MSAWWLYLIRCKNKTLYTGITTDVKRRLSEHQAGSAKS